MGIIRLMKKDAVVVQDNPKADPKMQSTRWTKSFWGLIFSRDLSPKRNFFTNFVPECRCVCLSWTNFWRANIPVLGTNFLWWGHQRPNFGVSYSDSSPAQCFKKWLFVTCARHKTLPWVNKVPLYLFYVTPGKFNMDMKRDLGDQFPTPWGFRSRRRRRSRHSSSFQSRSPLGAKADAAAVKLVCQLSQLNLLSKVGKGQWWVELV